MTDEQPPGERFSGGLREYLAKMRREGHMMKAPEGDIPEWEAFLEKVFEEGSAPEWDEEDA